MEKIIFFVLVIPIFAFVLYLGGNAIMKGMSAKNANKENENSENNEVENSFEVKKNLSEEICYAPYVGTNEFREVTKCHLQGVECSIKEVYCLLVVIKQLTQYLHSRQ